MTSETVHHLELGESAKGNLICINNNLTKLQQKLETYITDLENTERQEEATKVELENIFPEEEELNVKLAILEELDRELNLLGELNDGVAVEDKLSDVPKKESIIGK